MLLIRFLIILPLLINCESIFQKSIEGSSEVTTFAFDSHRSGAIRVDHQIDNYSKMINSSPVWGRDALKHMPLYLKRRNKEFIVVFGTKEKTLRAINPKTKKIVWEIDLPGFLLVTPVYSKKKRIIYILVREGSSHPVAIAVGMNGKILDRRNFSLEEIYGSEFKHKNMDHILIRTALGLNEISEQPYIFFGLATGRDPLSKRPKRDFYGQTQGLTGAVVAIILRNQNGLFDQDTGLKTFFTSKSDKDLPYTGFNSGVYLAGGAITLLKSNDLLVPVANGPSFPTKDNYGCSLVLLDGDSFKVKGYLSKDLEGYHECFITNKEFGNSYPNIIEIDQGTFLGSFRDKSGDIYFFNPFRMSQNKIKKRVSLSGEEVHGGVTGQTYSGGSLIKTGEGIHAVFGINGRVRSGLNKVFREDSLGTKEVEEDLLLRGFSKVECLGLIAKKGTNPVSMYYSGAILDRSFLAKNTAVFETQSLKELNQVSEIPLLTAVKDQKIPFKNLKRAGYEVEGSGPALKGYQLMSMHVSAFQYYSGLFDFFINDQKVSTSRKNSHLVPFKVGSFKYYAKNDPKNIDCTNFPEDSFVRLQRYSRVKNITNSFSLHGFKVDSTLKYQKVWTFKGGEGEQLNKSSLITVVHQKQDSYTTVFNATNIGTNTSYIYFIDTLNGNLLTKEKIQGQMHFSSLVPISNGFLVPSLNNGIEHLRFQN
ncbi:MAG: hypothetical protein CME65_02700 [Halobacteriovoraceae bacterium]|nr:hypothetical protein [Halobacteriovoraceae bacterium]